MKTLESKFPKRFVTLDGMRGVAALAVVCVHVAGVPGSVFSGGYLAVDFFFCLSGFVLAHAYDQAPLSMPRFLRLRAIRLYPLYLAGLALGVIVAVISRVNLTQVAGAAAFSLFFLPTPFVVGHDLPAPLYPLDPPAWSLFFEIVANAVWFALRRRLSGATALIALGGCAALFVWTFALYDSVNSGSYWMDLWSGFGRVFYGFLAGVLTYRLWRRSAWRPRLPSWLIIAGLVLILAAPVDRRLFDIPAVLTVPALVYLGACCRPADGGISASTQRGLGDSSYAIYTLHYPVIAIVAMIVATLKTAGVAHAWAIGVPLTFLLVIAGALWLDRIYDRPLRRWLLSLGRPRPSSAPQPMTASGAESPPTSAAPALD